MKTYNDIFGQFVNDALTTQQMDYIRGGGDDSPIDIVIPPDDPSNDG